MKIVDCFIFYNELDMLNYRLSVLDEHVDYFILVESTHTHTGVEKTCTFHDYKELYEQYASKIIHIIVDDFPHKQPNMDVRKNQQWINENFQRNCIKRGINKLKLAPDDVLLVSDLDEIPDPNMLAAIKRGEIKVDIQQLVQDFYYYNLNSKMAEKWFLAKAVSYKKYLELNINFQEIRMFNRTRGCAKIENGGWHLSYFGDKYFIRNKIQNFTHQEFNKEQFTDLDKIEEHINTCTDIYNRNGTKLIRIPISENKYLPPKYEDFLGNFVTF